VYFERLHDLRKDHFLTQAQIAQLLHIDQRVYSTYETGKRAIPLEHLIRLADHYGTSVDYLLGRTDVRQPYPKAK